MKKRILGVILVLCLLFAFLPSSLPTAQAYSDTDIIFPVEGGNLYFDKSSGTITDCDETVTSANIPSEIDSVAVTSIGKLAFYSCSSLTSVTIPDSVTYIGAWAFDSCSSLTSVTIPNSVTNIGDYAFYSCNSLTSVAIPDSVTYIGAGAFDDTAIYNAEEQWVDNVLYIGKWLIKAKEDIIGEYSICQGTVGIAGEGFLSCCSLTTVTIPNSVISIGDRAFFDTSLTNVIIPDSVTSIGHQAFSYCSNLTGIWVDEGNISYCNDEFGVLFDAGKKTLLQAPCGISGEYAIPNGVTSIDVEAFENCSNLTGVEIPDGVTSIGFLALSGTGLTSVTIPASVTSIGNYAFYDCINLTSVYFMGNAPALGKCAFQMWDYEEGTHANIPWLTLYYIEGKEGWTSPTWNGYPTATWTPPHEHAYTDIVTSPTCTEQGYTMHICECGDSYIDTYTDALGHDFGDWTQTKAPTCTEKGEEKRTCSRCGAYETREVASTGHTEVIDSAVAATCTETGLTEGKHCAVCNTVLVAQEIVAALGHDYGTWMQTKAPTCTETGEEKRVCSRCEVSETREVAVLGHDYENGVCVRCGEKDPNAQKPVEFADVPKNAWYVGAVEYAVQNGLMNGVGGDQFNPEGSMTRAMLVTVLWRFEGEPEAGKNTFSDVPNGQWYTDAVAWAAANGVVNGVGNNRFDPEGKITREQMATILYRYAEKKGIDTSKRAELGAFPDANQVSAYAKDPVQWAVAEKIINGSDGKLLPQGDATRAQVATILMRFIENIVKK